MRLVVIGSLATIALAIAMPALAQKTVGEHVDDGWITTEVKSKLLVAKDVPSTDINIETYRGVVLLSGFVVKQSQIDTAVKVAKEVKGVKEVRNALSLHPSTTVGTKIDDTALVAKVKSALIDTKDVEAGQINVEARGGIVQLGGFVQSAGMRDRAMAVARGVSGVKSVVDAMFVKPKG
ncbi:MAG: BON domain-containing protein [Gammaproteobacteria bacterium]|nr:BON domain-containing protein [Gammaproteobacteria bacterium]